MFQIQGKVVHVSFPEAKGKLLKRQLVVEIPDDKYPDMAVMEALGEKVSLLDGLNPGDVVVAHFNIKGREWQGRYFGNLVVWKVDVVSRAQQPQYAPQQAHPNYGGGGYPQQQPQPQYPQQNYQQPAPAPQYAPQQAPPQPQYAPQPQYQAPQAIPQPPMPQPQPFPPAGLPVPPQSPGFPQTQNPAPNTNWQQADDDLPF